MAEIGTLPLKEQRLVIGLDYGTTYTGVAFATPNTNHLSLDEIDLIENWGSNMGNHKKIPSVISFSPSTEAMEQQWGYDLSEDAISMVHTKLELDLQDVTGELDLMLHALDGMKDFNFQHIRGAGVLPAYTDKTAEQVVTEYLSRVFEHLSAATQNFSEALRVRVPVDIVVTIPTEWSYKAKNSTYRAFTSAGFNHNYFPRLASVIFITEPEAAAIYTARYLKNTVREKFLKPNSCFILCDAGGGTVDVVSYKVNQEEPSLTLERIGIPTGDKCGAIYIDIAFKAWLRQLLGNKYYAKLDERADLQKISSHTFESKAMRELMQSFDVLKKGFHKKHRDMKLDLPEPLHNLTLENKVDGGQIIITNDTMTGFFNGCVGKIMDLLQGHIRQIDNAGKQVKNIFLVGGFGESPYLQEEIEFSLQLRKIKLRRPDTSWTAVVRGAVLHGIEKDTNSSLSLATSCPKHFGISINEQFSRISHEDKDMIVNPITNSQMVEGQLLWLLSKEDLVLSDSPTTVFQLINISFRESDVGKRELTIYSYSDDDDRPTKIQNSKDDLTVSHTLEYDLADVDRKLLEKSRGKSGSFFVARLKLTLALSTNGLTSALSWNGNELATGSEGW